MKVNKAIKKIIKIEAVLNNNRSQKSPICKQIYPQPSQPTILLTRQQIPKLLTTNQSTIRHGKTIAIPYRQPHLVHSRLRFLPLLGLLFFPRHQVSRLHLSVYQAQRYSSRLLKTKLEDQSATQVPVRLRGTNSQVIRQTRYARTVNHHFQYHSQCY